MCYTLFRKEKGDVILLLRFSRDFIKGDGFMKKRFQKILGVVLSSAMVMTPMMETMAAANKYDVTVEDVTGKVLFPGDSISGIEPVYIGPDGAAAEIIDGKWTNDTSQAYSMSAIEGEGGGLWLEPKGYVLTVNDGTSKVTGTDGSDTSNHFKAKEETEEDRQFPKDIAYYGAWSDVTVIADPAPEGQIFDHWEVESANVTLTDAYASETNFTMAEDDVTLYAVYVQAPAETEAPAAEEYPAEEIDGIDESDESFAGEPAAEEYPAEGSQDGGEQVIVIGEENGTEATPGESGAPETVDTPETTAPVLYHLTVENGEGSGDYEVGSEVTITADQVDGMVFAGWYTEAVTVWFADSTSAETTFSMPAEPVVVTATYTQAETAAPETEAIVLEENNNAAETEPSDPEEEIVSDLYTVEVEFGEGGGLFEEGAEVVVYADAAEEGQEFAGWVTSENLVLEDPASEEAIFTMPAEDVKLTATYKTAETEAAAETATEFESGETGVIDIEELETEAVDNNAGEESETSVSETSGTETEEAVSAETETETETETESEKADAPKYQVQLSSTDDITIVTELTLDEEGIPSSPAGETVTVKATEYDSQVLDHWTVTKADGSQEAITPTINPEDPYIASFIMPNTAVFVEAHYVELSDNEVQVVNGSGSGTYQEGDYVEITANAPAEGYRFKGWTVITGDVELDDDTADTTGFIMPDEPVQVKATYEVTKFTLTVENGSGDGTYMKGETVSLTADYPSEGKVFAGWEVTSQNASVSASDRYYSSITMPAANVTVKATYKAGPSPDYNEIQGITSGGEYLKGDRIRFTAVGNGMGNSNPNPGDYRYRPSGYQIGSVTGNWSNAPYTTEMAINGVGQYNLNVTFTKDIFDGNSWVSTGNTDTKSVTFYVVNALSVQTGDNSPIIPLAIAAVAALAVIIVLLVVRRRRRY